MLSITSRGTQQASACLSKPASRKVRPLRRDPSGAAFGHYPNTAWGLGFRRKHCRHRHKPVQQRVCPWKGICCGGLLVAKIVKHSTIDRRERHTITAPRQPTHDARYLIHLSGSQWREEEILAGAPSHFAKHCHATWIFVGVVHAAAQHLRQPPDITRDAQYSFHARLQLNNS